MKLVFFIPAVVFTLFYGWAALVAMGTIHPIAIVWLLLLWIAGVLLNKSMPWGGILGAIPAVHFIYMGTQETGQIISETPIGIIILVFYLLCCIFVLHKKKKATE